MRGIDRLRKLLARMEMEFDTAQMEADMAQADADQLYDEIQSLQIDIDRELERLRAEEVIAPEEQP